MLLRSTRVLAAAAVLSIATTAIALHANSVSPAPAPSSPSSRAAAPQTSAECWTASVHGVPQVVRSKLAKLFPSGQLIDRGQDRDDGYYWFEVRSDRKVWDVEISEKGKLLKKVIDAD